MLVKFVRDFRGRATAEQYYTAGTVVDLPEGQAVMVLAEGAAVPVVEPASVVPPPTTEAGTSAKPARKTTARKTKRGLVQ
jgi:hypothetical protein